MEFVPRLPDDEVNVSKTHPLKEAALLAGGLTGALALLMLITGWVVDYSVRWIPPEVEKSLFEGFQFDLLGENAEDPERQAQVQELLDRLVVHWPDAPYPFEIVLIDSADPNAAALPGGVILVTTALLDQAESENEIAFVLGHELGHFHGRDHLRRLGRGVVFGLGLAALGVGGGGVPDMAVITGELTTRGFDRDQERDADAFGLDLVHQEYGHVASTWDFFQRLSEDAPLEAVVAYLSTHPASRERIEDLFDLARSRSWETEGDVAPFEEPDEAPAEPTDEPSE